MDDEISERLPAGLAPASALPTLWVFLPGSKALLAASLAIGKFEGVTARYRHSAASLSANICSLIMQMLLHSPSFSASLMPKNSTRYAPEPGILRFSDNLRTNSARKIPCHRSPSLPLHVPKMGTIVPVSAHFFHATLLLTQLIGVRNGKQTEPSMVIFGNVKIGLFGGFCGRDSGIGPAQRAKTTIWN